MSDNNVVKTMVCPNCKGKGSREDEDGIKIICKKCDGLAEVCVCCHKKKFLCKKMIDIYEEFDDDDYEQDEDEEGEYP